MRISEVTAVHVAARLREGLGASNRRPPLQVRQSLVVRMTTDDGLVGYGECSGPPAVLSAAVNHLAPTVLGADLRKRNLLVTGLMARALEEGPGGLLVAATGGIDIALWDLSAKALGVSLSTLLGGAVKTQVPVYAASIYLSPLDQAVQIARQFVSRGFHGLKIKVGLGVDDDLARVARIREAVGPDISLLLDANCAFDVKSAIALARRCAEYNISWFEEPVPAHDLEGCRAVRRAVLMPVAAGENLHARHGFEPWLTRRAVDVAMPDLGRCGGLTEAIAVASMARACGIAISPHCWGSSVALAASVQLAAVLPHCRVLEYDAHPDPVRDALIGEALTPQAGAMTVPDRPGIGIEVREDALRELAISGASAG
ncbi:MAG: mandelate racemase/muconate lactonizing enzyme family protein [bacterium]